MAALAYGNQTPEGEEREDPERGSCGVIAPFARRNYYREAVKRLQRIGVELRSRFGGRRSAFQILCNSRIPEKPLALACGLGALGRNGLIITPEAGSLVILAAMTLPYPLDGDPPLPDGEPVAGSPGGAPLGVFCGGCDGEAPPCVAACPTAAVRGDGTIDRKRCLQWYASGKEDAVPPEVAARWGRRLYGCTECQDACVHNRRPIGGAETGEGVLPARMDCRELLGLDDEALKARFKGSALGLSWLGPGAIRRNARLCLGT